jgi:aminomethyltransferase
MNRTPFYDKHVAHGGKIVDFFGWELPVQYSTITLEHNAVRNAAGLFDISHMGQLFVWGGGAFDFLQHVITNDLNKADIGKGIYAHLLNEQAGVIDDIFVYRLEEDKFLLIVNASRREEDTAWLNRHAEKFEVEIMEAPYAAALALQGPRAIEIASRINPEIETLPRFGIADFTLGDVSALVGRTGYTGEDGVEFFAPAGHMLIIWDLLLKAGHEKGLTLCGLGARDTLRTEVAYPLYGHELDLNHTPYEAGLGWVVKLDKGNFIGRDALIKKQAAGFTHQLAGFQIDSGGVARPGGILMQGDREIGTVASGTFGPSVNKAIGMAYVPVDAAKVGTPFKIRQGTRELAATICKMPFYKKPAVIGA